MGNLGLRLIISFEIVMDENAVLGPVDPQLGNFPAASLLKVVFGKSLAPLFWTFNPNPSQCLQFKP